jgi:hypothetical protein
MKRREFITLLGVYGRSRRAQQHNQLRRVGVVMAYTEGDPNEAGTSCGV